MTTIAINRFFRIRKKIGEKMKLGVTGTVKNEEDGSVTIEAIGNDDIIQKFIEEVKKSPSPSGR
ncbi:acylphosphatase, partial [Enterococcus faecium]|uniref:acylphosphatase n=1 Tax=Enterococcus faecium TaxID=1352 RepID=UPI003977872A